MAIFRNRLSTQDLVQLLVFSAFPIHIWAIVNMLRDVPSWLYYMKTSEVIAAIAYTLAFALFETLTVFTVLCILGMLIPRRWWTDSFVTLSSVWLVELAVMAAIFQHLIVQYLPKRLVIVGFLMLLAVTAAAVPRATRLKQIGRMISDRLAILTYLYLIVDVLGVVIVVARNV